MRYILLTLSLLIFQQSTCHAIQENDSALWLRLLSNQPEKYSYPMSLNGYATFAQYPNRDNTYYSASDFYLHPVIIEELKLSPKKQKAVQEAFEEFHKTWEDKLFDFANNTEPEKKDSQSDTLDKFRASQIDDLTRRIDSSLTETQKVRLRQIQLRFLIHQNGFCQTFKDETIRKLLKIPHLNTTEVEKQQKSIARDVLKEQNALAMEALDDWLSDLDPEQREVFDERWQHIVSGTTTRSQLILQLDSNLKPAKFDPKDPFDVSSAWPVFEFDVAGGCVVKNLKDQSFQWSPLGRVYWLQHFVHSAHFQRDIELVDEQIAEFKELNQQFNKYRLTVNELIGKKHGILPRTISDRVVYTLTTTEQRNEFERAMAVESRLYYDKHMDVFLPHQIDLLRAVVGNINTRLQGPLAGLLWGDLGRILQLDEAAKETLKKKADESRKHLQEESKRIYDETISTLVKLAPESDRAKLRSCLGDEFKAFAPALDGFLVPFFE